MALRFVLLALLPFAAVCQPVSVLDNDLGKIFNFVGNILSPCLSKSNDCPSMFWLDLAPLVPMMQFARQLLDTPKECKCDLQKDESCIRGCYYAYSEKLSLMIAVIGETNETAIAIVRNETKTFLEQSVKPCILEGKNCDMFSDPEDRQAFGELLSYLSFAGLPAECDCSFNSIDCIRGCFSGIVRKFGNVAGGPATA